MEVSAILLAARVHELNMPGSMAYAYWEKERSRVKVFFQLLNEIGPGKNIRGTSNMHDYTGGIYLTIWQIKRNLSCFEREVLWTSFLTSVIH